MTACRVARRIALTMWLPKPHSSAVSVGSLATNVFHLLFHPIFTCWRDGRLVVYGEHGATVGQSRIGWRAAGVWPGWNHLARRIALTPAPTPTPSTTSSWVPKDRQNGVAR